MRRLGPSLLAWCLSVALAACGDDPQAATPTEDAGPQDVALDPGDDADDAGEEDAPNDAANDADVSTDADAAGDADADEPDAGPLAGLCGPCQTDGECEGEGSRCLQLPNEPGPTCATSCQAGDEACPEGYACVEVQAGVTTERLCVPQTLVCEDRCAGVTCPQGRGCDPITGVCEEVLGLCDLDCRADSLCGGPEDLCLGLNEGEVVCATGCEDSRDCPLNYFCALLDEEGTRGACVPLDVTCVTDRCEDVDCGPSANCDPRTGECVRREVSLCEPCNELPSSACGDGDDLCLTLNEGEVPTCTQDCTATGLCPNEGYACVILNNTTRRACVPVLGAECGRCGGVECGEGESCDPRTGECVSPARDCVDDGCEAGQVCNPESGACEVVDEACTFETRTEDCFGPVRRCTATRRESEGTCALVCQTDAECQGGAPNCVELDRIGEVCVPDGLGGPQTCGVLSEAGVALGRRCGAGVATPCEAQAPECVQGVDAQVQGFCSKACQDDADCGEVLGATCQALRGRPEEQRYCLPSNCLCLAGEAVPQGERDLLGELLSGLGRGRCSFGLDPTAQVHLDPATGRAPLRPLVLGGLLAQPLSAPGFAQPLQGELLGGEGRWAGRDAILAAAARQGVRLEAREPVYAIPDRLTPLQEGLARFAAAAGGDASGQQVTGDVEAWPAELQGWLAQVLFAAAEVLEVRQGMLDAAGISPEEAAGLFEGLPYLFLTPPTGVARPDLGDEAWVARVEGLDLAPLYQAAADLAAVLEQRPEVDLSAVGAAELRLSTPAGWVILGRGGDTRWDPAQDPALGEPLAVVVDLSGDDTYLASVGATTASTQPLGLLVDLSGDDTYGYEAVPSPRDQAVWMPSDAGGRLEPTRPVQSGDGPISLSDTARQGAGRLGVGILFDVGGGDSYRSLRMSQGVGVGGVGLLYDGDGADAYEAEALAQGAGVLGLGVLVDGSGPEAQDRLRVWHAGQGFGSARGVGLVYELDGPTVYVAEPAAGLRDVLYFCPPDRGLSNLNLAQGAGAGRGPADLYDPTRQALGGGVGVLLDGGGDDVYSAASFSQGAGFHLGVGFLLDRAGEDRYEARLSSQGSGDSAAFGYMEDGAGQDAYNRDQARLLGGLLGSGQQQGAGFLLERGGDDVYRAPRASAGAGQSNGLGVFVDLGGVDDHTATNESTWGYGLLGPEVVELDDPRRVIPTVGIFLDAGEGEDRYTRPDLEEPTPTQPGNDRAWLGPALDGTQGAGLDGAGLTGLE